jgi:hypothetical protein
MEELSGGFVDFLMEAKRRTYAAGAPPGASCRAASKDLSFSAGDYDYLDSYFGGIDFLGNEVVYRRGIPVWGMNYYGRAIADADAGQGPEAAAMGEVLHAALMEVPREAPYRGPRLFKLGDCEYRCAWDGRLEDFWGEEAILRDGKRMYFLRFHGGSLS